MCRWSGSQRGRRFRPVVAAIVPLPLLAQAELRGAVPDFLYKAFAGEPPTFQDPIVGDSLAETVLAGGCPEALTLSRWRRRRDWHLDYIEAIVQRDVRDNFALGLVLYDHEHAVPIGDRMIAAPLSTLWS